MLKKTLLAAICIGSVCFADNFMIGSSLSGAPKSHGSAHDEAIDKAPQRAVIEDVNPSSDLGQLVNVMLKNEQKKAAALAAAEKAKAEAAKKKKIAAKKKAIAKKKAASKEANATTSATTAKDPYMEIKAEDPTKISESEKKAAEHNEKNSSIKKISSSKAHD